jgi:hypothetical protein
MIPDLLSLRSVKIEVMNVHNIAGFHRSFKRRHRSFPNIADLISNISHILLTHTTILFPNAMYICGVR